MMQTTAADADNFADLGRRGDNTQLLVAATDNAVPARVRPDVIGLGGNKWQQLVNDRGEGTWTLSFAGIALMAACGTGRKFTSGDGLNQPKDGGATDSTSAASGATDTDISEGTTPRYTDESMTGLQYTDGGLQGAELGPCMDGETEPCGPENEDGICRFGVRHCVNSLWGACEGAIFSATRNCESVDDNDCNGEPDNTVDNVCTCVPGSVKPCDEHVDLDGRGPCRAGERVCISSDDRARSTCGACEGSVGPADADSCTVGGTRVRSA